MQNLVAAELLEPAAAGGPVLVAIDDAHWIDPLSRLTLRALPGRLSGWPLVWVFAGRPADTGLLSDLQEPLLAGTRVEAVQLHPLTAGDTMAIATDRLGQSA